VHLHIYKKRAIWQEFILIVNGYQKTIIIFTLIKSYTMKSILQTTALLLAFFILSCEREQSAVPRSACSIKCSKEPQDGPCNAAFYRYFFNKKTMRCDTFIWGGCAGVVPFKTLAECKKCDCTYEDLPSDANKISNGYVPQELQNTSNPDIGSK
jgi:Kunitz/Bovine pancreatic trypsin inhibitor domain